jgi:uncharacterized protein YbjT (DUF2867 family)
MAYKTFAVAGAGTLGKYVLEGLAKAKSAGQISSVVALTRSVRASRTCSTDDLLMYWRQAEGNPEATKLGVPSVQVDYASPTSLSSALKGVDVLISTLGIFGLGLQGSLAEAAKEAGVKLFVPAEYGAPAIDMGGGKSALRRKCTELGLPFTVFFVGVFMHTFFGP